MRSNEEIFFFNKGRGYFKKSVPRDELEELYVVQGKGFKFLSNYFSVSMTTIKKRLVEYDIPIRPRNFPYKSDEYSYEKIYHLYVDDKLAIGKISRMLGCSDTLVRRRLEDMGVPFRTRSETWKIKHEVENACKN